MASNEHRGLDDLIDKMKDKLFGNGSTPSVEYFFQVVREFGVDVFNMYKKDLEEMKVDELIKEFPDEADKACKFVLSHVVPALLSKLPSQYAKEVIREFLQESLRQIIEHGTVRGRHFLKLMMNKAMKCATSAVATNAVKEGTESVAGKISKTTCMTMEMTRKTIKKTKTVVNQFSSKTAVKTAISETVEEVATTGSIKITDGASKTAVNQFSSKTAVKTTFSSKTSTQLSKSGAKEVAKVGIKSAAKAGAIAAVAAGVIGGVFFIHDMKELVEKNREGKLGDQEYRKRRNGRIGEYAGDVIGSGLVGTGLCLAGLSGPIGWLAVGGGALVSYGVGRLGNHIGRNI